MKNLFGTFARGIKGPLALVPSRARWSFIDQILISGANVATSILLVRALGLHDFGVYSMVMIGVQFLASMQTAGILAPMMSLFDKRGDVSQSSYLAAVLFHQTLYAGIMLVVLAAASAFAGFAFAPALPIDFGLMAALAISMQFQDLSRRFYYVTERPAHAFSSDLVAYGARLILVAVFAFENRLTIVEVWSIVIGTNIAALALLTPDLFRLDTSWPPIKKVTDSHKKIAGWLIGNSFVGWFSEGNFAFLIIGTILGPVQLGGARAVQSVVLVVNLLLQSLENFVPSAATRALEEGGGSSLLRYVGGVSWFGAAGIMGVIAVLMIFADPIMLLVYGRTFPDQLAILAILGTYLALGHITMVVTAGLRALEFMRAAFVARVVVGVVSIALLWLAAQQWGVVGALSALLIARVALTARLALLLHNRASMLPVAAIR